MFIDRASGKFARRLELDAAFDFLRADDVLVITKLDRLGCSVRNLIDLSDALQARDVGLRVLEQGIDTTTPVGRMFFHVLAAIAEFEAALISDSVSGRRVSGTRTRPLAASISPLDGLNGCSSFHCRPAGRAPRGCPGRRRR
ncbi:MAG: recombinase family protein [Actinomycetota bacterium]|nr:recombinase family protein [Actinomycetota bacterium]